MTTFDALPWHDAVLLGVYVDRRSPGVTDEVVLEVEWPDGRREQVRILNAYRADLAFNFGVMGDETIRHGKVSDTDRELDAIKKRWLRLGVNLSDLRVYRVTTNSTASEIRVFAEGFKTAPLTPCGEAYPVRLG